MLDRPRILAKLLELEGYVTLIREVTPPTAEAYRSDIHRRLESERLLHIGIECLLDVAELFVRGLRLGLPHSEGGFVDRLREGGVLPEDDLRLLKQMQGFRNVLVHRYDALQDEKVYGNLRRAPGDFTRLARAFRDALDAWGKA